MRATFLHGSGDVRVETAPDPTIREASDAIVRVLRTCVCGSDLHPYRAMRPGGAPGSMGHEFVGIVEELGPEVGTLARGDFVIGTFAYQDNTCAFCRDGVQTSCVNGGFYGSGEMAGAQAEFVRAPLADGSLVVVPDIDENSAFLPSLLTLSDVYLTGFHGARLGRVKPGKFVTVIGDGAVGLSAVLAARRLGAERIALMGRHQSRTDLGVEFGATDVVSERGAEGVGRIMDMTSGTGSHTVIEAVGHLSAYEQAYGIVRPGGTIVRLGVPQYDDGPLGFEPVFRKNISITGGPAPVRAYIEEAIKDVVSGAIEPGRVFDQSVSLDNIAEGYRAMDERASLKALVTP